MAMTRSGWAKLACLYGGFIWGTFWIPVRELAASGISDFWAVTVLYGLVAIAALPLAAWRWRRLLANGWRQQVAGIFLGSAMAIYGAAFLFTEVATAVLLYYLSPVWGFLLARLVLGDPITPIRWLSMCLALGGAAVILGGGNWPPVPNNLGDWLSLSAGVLFVIGSLMMLSWTKIAPFDYMISFLIWSGVITVGITFLIDSEPPTAEAVQSVMFWLIPFVLLVLMPGSYAILFGAAVLNPGVVGILYMSEIGVSVFLASILTDEPFGWRQIVGIVLIALAGSAEGLLEILRRRRQVRRARA